MHKYTTYNYNPDDSIESVVDARGAETSYTYNGRGLVTNIDYSVPTGSGIEDPASVVFGYDNIGNRTSMTDGLGSVSYAYDSLSRLTSETRDFTDTLTDAPISGGQFMLEYTYNISGGLKSLKDPFGHEFNYSHDLAGRLRTVTGSTAFDTITNYASSPSYNARGILKGLTYGNGVTMAVTGFNAKLQATGFEVKKGTTAIIDKDYEFYNDGSLKFIDDVLDGKFDRLYKYDHAGRTVEAKAGTAANGQPPTGPHNFDQPYTMAYTHDAFGHITGKEGYYYSSHDENTHSYTDNRNPTWGYDADGNTTYDDDAVYKFDAAGRLFKTEERELDGPGLRPPTVDGFDGDGQLGKRVRNFGSTTPAPQPNYYIRSSVLGRVVSEVGDTGKKLKTFVPANGVTLAQQQVYHGQSTTTERLTFVHQDASGTGTQETESDGSLASSSIRSGEYDAMGRDLADSGPYITLNTDPPAGDGGSGVNLFGSGEGYRPGRRMYAIDGHTVPASRFMNELDSGLIGGAFGLLEISARMSNRLVAVGVNTKDGPMIGGPGNETRIGQIARTTGNTLHRFFLQNDFWAVSLTLFQTRYKSLHDAPYSRYSDPRTTLKPRVDKALNETCKKKLNDLLGRLKSSITDIDQLANNAYDNVGISLSMTNDPVAQLWEKGNTLFSKGRYRPAPAGETVNGSSILINRNTAGGSYETITFLHELLHTSRKGNTHQGIARAIADLEGVRPELDKYLRGQNDSDNESSGFINSWINENCVKDKGTKSWKDVLTEIGVTQ